MADNSVDNQDQIVNQRLTAVILIGLFLLLLLILIAIFGCASLPVKHTASYQPNCVAVSIMSAWTYQLKGHETRIAISNIARGIDHAQAEAKIDGTWVPLTPLWNAQTGLTVEKWSRHFPAEPYRYLTLEEFITEQGKILRGE